MFAIGMSVREARERLGLTVAEVEHETRIRAKHLRAIEAERFDELPGRAYARAFLREYVEFLGLDSQVFLAEFDEQFPLVEEEPIVPVGLPHPWHPRHVGAVVAAAGLAVLALLGVRAESDHPQPRPQLAPAPVVHVRQHVVPPTPKPRPRHREPQALVLVAARGSSWIEAHAGSRAGPLLYRSTLATGRRLRLPAARLWLRLGAPWNLEARLGGRRIVLPSKVANVVITPRHSSV
jgi:Helix-turn-helix domain